MTNNERGIKLRSGKVVLPRESYYDYSDSDSDYDSYDHLCDEKIKPLLTNVPPPPVLDVDPTIEEREEREFQEFVIESIEEKITSEIGVPSGFGQVAGEYLEKLNGCYQDCWINHDQLHELVGGFDKYLSWFPDDVPQKKIKKFCREAYNHVLWKTLLDEKISDRQFLNLMRRKPKFFRKRK